MHPKANHLLLLMLAPALTLVSCSSEEQPFTYSYISRDRVEIGYQGKSYLLQQGKRLSAPFAYAFEPDGDLDITIERRTYEIDSPFDADTGKKRRKTLFRKSFGKKKSRRR